MMTNQVAAAARRDRDAHAQAVQRPDRERQPLPLLALGRTAENAFLDRRPDPRGLGQSKLAYHFLGGLHGPCPGAGGRSSRRPSTATSACRSGATSPAPDPGFTWTPAFITYGDNNRTHMFRTPEPGRFECRAVSGAVNPYLGDGRRSSPRAWTASSATSTRASRSIGRNMYEIAARADAPRGPRGTSRSRCPRRSTSSRRTRSSSRRLGPELAAEFLRVKRQEWVRYHNDVGRWEVDQYLTLF